MKDDLSVDCNDEGVIFSEAHIENKLDDLLQEAQSSISRCLFPDDLPWNRVRNSAGVLAIRLSFFACGGFTIGVCISHKIVDGSSTFTFLNDWATIARGSDAPSVSPPQFIASSLLPSNPQFIIPEAEIVRGDTVTRRFVFSTTKIASLKAMIISGAPETLTPTRVQAVAALIYKHAHRAASGTLRKPSTLLAQTVNMRHRIVPPLPDNVIGNILWFFHVIISEMNDVNLGHLVRQMRDGLDNVSEFGKHMVGDRLFLALSQVSASSRIEHDAFKCGFPAYDVDFGFGKPVWVGAPDYPYKNSIFLSDTKCGQGIEVWVTLEKQAMSVLECDAEFLEFASLKPPVIVD